MHLFPVIEFIVETKYCDFSSQDVYAPPTTAQYNPGQQSSSMRHAGSNLHRHGRVSIVGGEVIGSVGSLVGAGVGISVGVEDRQAEGSIVVGLEDTGSLVG